MLKPFYQPVRPFKITQYFGENSACESLDGSRKVINCDGHNPPAGYKSLYGPAGHKGIDIAAKNGQPVYCVCEGVVDFIDTQPRSGLDVRIVSVVDGVKYMHIYEHLLGHNNMKIDQKVPTGACVGWADNTGYSSSDHLHFEVRKWINGKWVSIDPLTMINQFFAPDVTAVNSIRQQMATLLEKLVDMLRAAQKSK